MTTVWYACQENAVIAAECKGLFEPAPLDSEMAKWERQSREDSLKENNLQEAPAMAPRVEAALVKSEGGRPTNGSVSSVRCPWKRAGLATKSFDG